MVKNKELEEEGMTKVFCDKCKDEIKESVFRVSIKIRDAKAGRYFYKTIDLCGDCGETLKTSYNIDKDSK